MQLMLFPTPFTPLVVQLLLLLIHELSSLPMVFSKMPVLLITYLLNLILTSLVTGMDLPILTMNPT
jgi:hypothetical protein